jgi:hypothetical protein
MQLSVLNGKKILSIKETEYGGTLGGFGRVVSILCDNNKTYEIVMEMTVPHSVDIKTIHYLKLFVVERKDAKV